MLFKILNELKQEKKYENMQKYLNIDLNSKLDMLWKDNIYVDDEWYYK